MSGRPDPFWICHECGAQMRPIRRDGMPHCASCDSEFIEILDSSVNPDPYHDLPPPPPLRPQSSPPSSSASRLPHEHEQQAGGGFMQSLFSNLFGAAAVGDDQQHHQQQLQHPRQPSSSGGPQAGGSGGGSRSWQFTLPGGGRGQVMFGSMGGQGFGGGMGFGGGGGGQHGDDPEAMDRMDGIGSFFPGFGPPPGADGQRNPYGPGDPLAGQDLLRALMQVIAEDGMMPPQMMMGGPQGRMNVGDYVTSQQGFDQILEQLMQVAGPQGPIPASDVVIEGLPRFKFDEQSLEKSPFKDCPVCKDDFAVGDEVMRIPCAHVFHPDCLEPWLKVNGSCPVCRFSLVPDDANRPGPSRPNNPSSAAPSTSSSAPADAGSGTDGQSTITNILQRLWGQSGAPTAATDAQTQSPPPATSPAAPVPPPITGSQSGAANSSAQPGRSPAAHSASDPEVTETIPTAIPEDYRERHRQREREQHREEPPHEDLD